MKMKVLALLAAVVMMLAGFGALAESGELTVHGTGMVYLDADQASINIGVREYATDVATAQATVNEKIAAVIAAMKDMGVAGENISTSGIGIYPNYDYSDGETIIGYNAYNTLCVVISDAKNVGAYIDAAFAAGANSLDYVEFSASDTSEAADKALALAVECAKAKAQVLADAAGVKLGEILSLQDDSDNYGFGASPTYARSEDAGAKGTDVLASSQNVTANVVITFAIGD